MQEGINDLISLLLSDQRLNVEIETNGSIAIADFIPADRSLRRPVFTLDYKLPSSGMEAMMLADNYDLLTGQDTVKFVCGNHEDLERAYDVNRKYALTDKCNVYISPVFGQIDPADMVEFMKENRMNGFRLQLQLHKLIWNPDKRGV